ncbi:glycogen debranching protein [Planctomycetota bacterium]
MSDCRTGSPGERSSPSGADDAVPSPTAPSHATTAAPKPAARWESTEGAPYPLGVSWIAEEQAYNFAIYSKHATTVILALFRSEELTQPIVSYELDPFKNKSGPIWHCRIPASKAEGAAYYGYRVDGPQPGPGFAWHDFDSEKILLDPYAKSIFFPKQFSRRQACQPGSNAGRAPLAVLCTQEDRFAWGNDRPVHHDHDLILYEMHVKGFTYHSSSGVTTDRRGTFSGVSEKIEYLRELGVTAVELMPVFQCDPQEGDYWGYMPLSFFSPHHEYSARPTACRQTDEFRQLVKSFHEAGIEVILDVVYNHTCEGNHLGPTYSLRGIDSSTYYMATGSRELPYANYSGTGNTLHTANRAVRQLVVDSLRYWVTEMHVDGFRFDLASIFTRRSDGSVNVDDPPILGQIAADPALAGVRLIAEPWDAGGAYQLGQRFPGTRWMQWNSKYRDTIQQFVRGDPGLVGDLMTRVYGSCDLFPDERKYAFRPYQSANYITSHDGFTLYDLVSYNEKNNWANGHDNTDGANDYSWNCGWEGDAEVPPEVGRLRKQQVKNFCCLLLLSSGTPMFRMGDEFMHTQGGNNNPYNQDNETNWLDWAGLKENQDVFRFFTKMIAFRKNHPSISRSGFWREDVHWYGVSREVDMSRESRTLAYCLRGKSRNDQDLYVMINAHWRDLRFGIHEGSPGDWRRVVATALPSPEDFLDAGNQIRVRSPYYDVGARSVVVLLRE